LVKKQIKIVKLIQENPKLTGNQLYKKSRKEGYGIAKSKFYQLLRDVRKLPEPTKEKKEKSIPIKYRKPIITKPPIPVKKPDLKGIRTIKKPGSEYGVIEVKYQKTGESRWIKYRNKKHLIEQLKKMEGSPIEGKYAFIDHGIRGYERFRTLMYQKVLDEWIKIQKAS